MLPIFRQWSLVIRTRDLSSYTVEPEYNPWVYTVEPEYKPWGDEFDSQKTVKYIDLQMILKTKLYFYFLYEKLYPGYIGGELYNW